MTEIQEFLKRFHFEPELIEEIEENAQMLDLEENQSIIEEGQFFRSVLIIAEGLVKMFRMDEDGNEFLIYYLEPGEGCAFSMVCSHEHQQSEVILKSVTPAKILMIPREKMDEWMTKYRSWFQFVVSSYRKKMEELIETIDQIAFKSLDERLWFYLKRHCDKTGDKVVHLSHKEIASELSTSREVISRLLKKLEQLNKVKLERNAITVLL